MGIFSDFLLAKAIRRIDSKKSDLKPIYLTFDDGPTPHSTDKILNLLDKERVKASFFCVANKTLETPSLFNEIVSAGHSIGNHSLDHTFRNFFLGRRKMFNWISESEQVFSKMLNKPTIGFRSPAGVITPELIWALKELKIPLIHWSVRFFDTQFLWTEKKALYAVNRLKKGDIILLHDTHNREIDTFNNTLNVFVRAAKEKGFNFLSITNV